MKIIKGRFVFGNHVYRWKAEQDGKTEYADTKREAIKRIQESNR